MRHPSRGTSEVIGVLAFSKKKILLTTKEENFYVKGIRIETGYLHGDTVKARIIKRAQTPYLAEVIVKSLIQRTSDPVIAVTTSSVYGNGREHPSYIMAEVDPSFGNIGKVKVFLTGGKKEEDNKIRITLQPGDTITICYDIHHDAWCLSEKLGLRGDPHVEEEKIYHIHKVRRDFPKKVLEEVKKIKRPQIKKGPKEEFFESSLFQGLENFRLPIREIERGDAIEKRLDFRSWYTMTIDGPDAKDLDDAISIIPYSRGGYLLGVHIADVSEYVCEGTELDKEALQRTTSIYTPGKVIPMLPEALSNDLCSLHPGEPKLVLSILMKIDTRGHVSDSLICEGVIESAKRGIYEEVEKYMGTFGRKSPKHLTGIIVSNDHIVDQRKHASDLTTISRATGASPGGKMDTPYQHEIISHFTTLFHILEARRKKEGKIIFESTEPIFDMSDTGEVMSIRPRIHLDAHRMIEEFMVLANEEVAKWCQKRNIPFLSRVHDIPPRENLKFIHEVIGYVPMKMTPKVIRDFMERSSSEGRDSTYLYSRILLPKMSKAYYSAKPHMHFGLALEHYSHFTSPIRRYPDLILHRIIKESLHHDVKNTRKSHYIHILPRIARACSDGEVRASDVEYAVDALEMCRYMRDKVGEPFTGRVSGMTEWAIFVELDTAVEVTIYLHEDFSISTGKRNTGTLSPRSHQEKVRYVVDSATGTLWNKKQKITQIGDRVKGEIREVDMGEMMIVGQLEI